MMSHNKMPKYELNIKAACEESDVLNQVWEWINRITRIRESNNKSDM